MRTVALLTFATLACSATARVAPTSSPARAAQPTPSPTAEVRAPRSDPRAEALRRSIREYRAAIALAPQRPEAWLDLGLLLLDVCPATMENFDRGHDHLRHAEELARREPRYAVLAEHARACASAHRCPPGTGWFGSRCGLTATRATPDPPAPAVDCAAFDAALDAANAP